MRSGTHSIQIVYQSPTDPGVWYAPETLLWCLVLVVGPAAVVALLSPLVYALLDALAKNAPKTAEARDAAAEASDPGFRLTALAFLYALILVSLAGSMVNRLAMPMRGANAIMVNTSPGLPAAAAILALPAAGFFAASLLSLAFIAHYRSAARGTGLASVVWLICGGVGCLITAFITAAESQGQNSSLALLWVVLGLVLLLIGLVRRSSSIDGVSILARAKQVEQQEHVQEAADAVKDAPTQGVYMGAPPILYWGRIASIPLQFAGFIVVAFYLLTAKLGSSSSAGMPPEVMLIFAAIAFGFGALVSLAVWLSRARDARLVRWDGTLLQVTWYHGAAHRYHWEQLSQLQLGSVRQQYGAGGNYATVHTATGQKWTIWERNSGYTELAEALKAHVW